MRFIRSRNIFQISVVLLLWTLTCNSHNSDSLSSVRINKAHFGIFIAPSLSSNIGANLVASYYDAADCTCGYSYANIHQKPGLSFSSGLEFISPTFANRFSLETGLNFDYYGYHGSAYKSTTNYATIPITTYSSGVHYYRYDEFFVGIPLALRSKIFIKKTELLSIHAGGNLSYYIADISNWSSRYEYLRYGNNNDHNFIVFANAGINYTVKIKPLISIGLQYTMAMTESPLGRRSSSVGIKVGAYL